MPHLTKSDGEERHGRSNSACLRASMAVECGNAARFDGLSCKRRRLAVGWARFGERWEGVTPLSIGRPDANVIVTISLSDCQAAPSYPTLQRVFAWPLDPGSPH